jgi:hypothetical protein
MMGKGNATVVRLGARALSNKGTLTNKPALLHLMHLWMFLLAAE